MAYFHRNKWPGKISSRAEYLARIQTTLSQVTKV